MFPGCFIRSQIGPLNNESGWARVFRDHGKAGRGGHRHPVLLRVYSSLEPLVEGVQRPRNHHASAA